jgi:hypothetical protein
MRNKGKLIVFEGIDGSGKGTQTKKLFNFLKNKGIKTELFEFPFYSETFFGKEVGNYLNGEFGGLKEIHPKLSAMLYAGDRYEKRDELIKKLNQGYLIICDRYVPSNIAHQTAKYNDIKEKNVCVEVCPISNRLSKAVKENNYHPVLQFIEHGVPFVLCSDNPSIHNKSINDDYLSFYHESKRKDILDEMFKIQNKYKFLKV